MGAAEIVALLLRFLTAYYDTSITVVESAVGTIGAPVLQSSAIMLHLLDDKAVQLLVAVLEVWGLQSTGISAKCLHIFGAVVEAARVRVNCIE